MTALAPARRLTLRTRGSWVSVVVGLVSLVALWEIASIIVRSASEQGDRVMPSVITVATTGFIGLADYYAGGFGVQSTALGGEQSMAGAVLALVTNGAVTFGRAMSGLVISIVAGVLLGMLISAVRPIRLAAGGIAELLRMLPALAMAPLFTLWFGATDAAAILFVVFSVTFLVLVGTITAIGNLPASTLEYPRTLGVRGPQLWVRVVLPAILPELRGTLVFGGLVSWTSVLAGEMYGLRTGLGWMLSETLRFSLVDRMVIVALVFSALALLTMKLLGGAVSALTRWS